MSVGVSVGVGVDVSVRVGVSARVGVRVGAASVTSRAARSVEVTGGTPAPAGRGAGVQREFQAVTLTQLVSHS